MAKGKWGQRKSKSAQSTKERLIKLLARIPNKKRKKNQKKLCFSELVLRKRGQITWWRHHKQLHGAGVSGEISALSH